MFRNLSPGAIGVRCSLDQSLEIARANGFEGVDLDPQQLLEPRERDRVWAALQSYGLQPGGWGVPVRWAEEPAVYEQDLKKLPTLAKAAGEIGLTRCITWIAPASNERDFRENFDFHIKRFRPIAQILADHGCRLGLEFIGPKTSRAGAKYEFIHNMEGMLQLCQALGTGNAGLLLDIWHWYTSHGTLESLRRLKDADVVYVHLNDAPAGVPVDEQIDNVRCLPGETGVIDTLGFLKALQAIGYTGPVTPEPFSKKLQQMPEERRPLEVGQAMLRVWRQAGLGSA